MSRNPLRMQIDKSFASDGEDKAVDDDLELLRGELPSGGARVINASDQTSLDFQQNSERFDPEIGDLGTINLAKDDDSSVPVLMDAVELGEVEAEHSSASAGKKAGKNNSDREEKLIIFYLINPEGTINGQMLLESLVPRDMSFGEMDIFHHKDEADNIHFSLANAVEPGSFKLSSIKDLETPGVILFMKAHEVDDPEAVFDEMVGVARGISEELGCQIRDETQSVVTAQTLEHYRQTIQEYSHRYQ